MYFNKELVFQHPSCFLFHILIDTCSSILQKIIICLSTLLLSVFCTLPPEAEKKNMARSLWNVKCLTNDWILFFWICLCYLIMLFRQLDSQEERAAFTTRMMKIMSGWPGHRVHTQCTKCTVLQCTRKLGTLTKTIVTHLLTDFWGLVMVFNW